MIFHGAKFGVTLFPGGIIKWFQDPKEAARIEKEEIAKFVAADRAREAQRLLALGVLQAPSPSYRIALADQQPGRKTRRDLH